MISDIEVTVSSSVVRDMDRVVEVLGSISDTRGFSNEELQVVADALNTLELLFCQDPEKLQFGELGFLICPDLPWYKGILRTMKVLDFDLECFLEVLDALQQILAEQEVEVDEYDFAEDFCYRLAEEIWDYFIGRHGANPVFTETVEHIDLPELAIDEATRILGRILVVLDNGTEPRPLIESVAEAWAPALIFIEDFAAIPAFDDAQIQDIAENFIVLLHLNEVAITPGRLDEIANEVFSSLVMQLYYTVGDYRESSENELEEADTTQEPE